MQGQLKPPRTSWFSKYAPKAGEGCVLWLPMQDDPQSAIVRDKSGSNNHGTIDGATWVRLASGLWVLSFDGTNDTVDCGAIDFTAMSAFSVGFWYYKAVADVRTMPISSGYPCWQLNFWETNFLGLEIQIDGAYKYLSSSGDSYTIPVGSWNYCGLSHKLDGTALWVKNGTEIGSSGATSGSAYSGSSNTFLSENADGNYPWEGYLALVRVYSTYIPAAKHIDNYRKERHLFKV